ncbi:MAG: 23S rRNA (uracil(1939)-C(5))-methyltransferase RlmD [Candidatus Hydrogenedens sp.]|nr:23S rRNA (uracil(1939)-C(5))-methyltransferase RlmD [Candidatus Hydrogenedens sp.]
MSSAPLETAALCPHFGECGGCQHQDWSYPKQLEEKARLLSEAYGTHWPAPIVVHPSPVLWHYRNKVDPAFAPMQYETPPPKDFVRDTVLGFKKKGRWFWPLDIETCLIGPAGLGDLLASVRDWYRSAGLRAYDNKRGGGFLRHLLVREAAHTGERMVVLITCGGDLDGAGFVEAVQRTWPAQSIQWGINDKPAEVAMADELRLLYGKESITAEMRIPDGDTVRPLRFRISPFSFFQTNSPAAEQLYGLLRRWVGELAPANLYDLYGGSGGIAFSCADLVGQIWSVEEVEAASVDGRYNAEVNGIGNVLFFTEDVKNFLKHRVEAEGLAADSLVIADPPRAGLHPKALKRLIELAPRHIIYVSCNPKILARELDVLSESYALARLEAVDLFPHTRHVEVVALLERK